MHWQWWSGISTVAILVCAQSVNAQSCEQLKLDGFEERPVTERLNTQRACILEHEQRLTALANSLEGLNDRALGNSSAIDFWEKERLPILETAADQQQAIDAIQLILGDSVLAFDRSQRTGACPRGWSLFEPAGGRMIVGAGRHSNGYTEYPAYKDKPNEATGGTETVTLTQAQMPSHQHSVARTTDASAPAEIDHALGRGRGPNPKSDFLTTGTGGSQPHNNMPPYIALYFCKKD